MNKNTLLLACAILIGAASLFFFRGESDEKNDPAPPDTRVERKEGGGRGGVSEGKTGRGEGPSDSADDAGDRLFEQSRREIEENMLNQMPPGEREQAEGIIRDRLQLQRQSMEERWQERGWPPPAPDTREAERQLLDIARTVPRNSYRERYELYAELATLNPFEPSYRSETEYYHQKVRQEQGEPSEDALAGGRLKDNYIPEPEKYTGNDKIKFTAEHLGRGGFIVWIVNAGESVLMVDPNYFSMIGKDGRKFSQKRSDSLRVNLNPGESAKGYIDFNVAAEPQKLVFESSSAGRAEQIFP